MFAKVRLWQERVSKPEREQGMSSWSREKARIRSLKEGGSRRRAGTAREDGIVPDRSHAVADLGDGSNNVLLDRAGCRPVVRVRVGGNFHRSVCVSLLAAWRGLRRREPTGREGLRNMAGVLKNREELSPLLSIKVD